MCKFTSAIVAESFTAILHAWSNTCDNDQNIWLCIENKSTVCDKELLCGWLLMSN